MSKCLWSGWKWSRGVKEITSLFTCCPVNQECLWKKTQIEKINLFVPISNDFINPFQANVPFLYPLKTSENLVFFCDCLYLAYFHHYLLLSHSRLEKQLKEQFLRKLFLVCPRKLFRSWSYASWVRNFSYFV